MSANYHQNLLNNYSTKIEQFLKDVDGIKTENLPEPFLPVIGSSYGMKLPKILFYGWETRGCKSLVKWIGEIHQSKNNAFTWWQGDFDELAFVKWRSNFNQDFWSFNLRLLAKIHNVPDWKELYKNPFDNEDILSSFAWANTDSIERYDVTAKGLNACYQSWQKLKNASNIFDHSKLILESLEPDIVILFKWDASREWLFKDLEIKEESKNKNYLWYYEISKPNLHLFWTSHPRGYQQRGLNADEMVEDIVSIYRGKS